MTADSVFPANEQPKKVERKSPKEIRDQNHLCSSLDCINSDALWMKHSGDKKEKRNMKAVDVGFNGWKVVSINH